MKNPEPPIMTSNPRPPEILHLSAREAKSSTECKWLHVNVVFKVFEELDRIFCDSISSPWTRTYLWEVDNPERIDLHYLHTTDPVYDISDKKRSGWAVNDEQLLIKIEKFNAYRFTEYVEDNSVTRSAIEMLKQLQNNPSAPLSSRFVPFSTLSRSLRVLNTFWD